MRLSTIFPEDKMASKRIRLKFTNQQATRDLILNFHYHRIALDAPAGYGKTYLLENVMAEMDRRKRKCIYVNLAYDYERGRTRDEIRAVINNALSPESVLKESIANNQIVVALNGLRKFTLMFDSVERAQPGITDWLQSQIIEPAVKMGNTDCQFIFAGRHIVPAEDPDLWRRRGYALCDLHNITTDQIVEVLQDAVSQVPDAPDISADYIHEVAENMAWLSAGHPGSIEYLVNEWLNNTCSQDFSPSTEPNVLREIFERSGYPHVQKFQFELGADLYSTIRVVSVFRMMDQNIMQSLEALDKVPDWEQTWSKLRALKLFFKRGDYYADGVVRQLVARALEITDPQLYKDYNCIARKTWEEQLGKLIDLPVNFTARGVLIREMLRNIIYQALGEGLRDKALLECITRNLFRVKPLSAENLEELVTLYAAATQTDGHSNYNESDWMDNLEIQRKLTISAEDVRKCLYESLPKLIQPTPAIAQDSSISNSQLAGSVLIVTVTKTEVNAVRDVFSQAVDGKWIRHPIGDKMYYDLGIHGGTPVFMVQSLPGTTTVGGALMTVSRAIRDLNPQAVIMCGIAFGLQPHKQELGDVLIAKQLLYYEPQKLDLRNGQMPRGDRTTSAERLLDRFRDGDNDWSGAHTHFGLVLSGEKLVNDSAFRDSLLEVEPEAIGGEMEGAGLYAAARAAKVDWILVKAICDWADGTKNDDSQLLAARNAAQFVLYVLQLGGWGRPE